MKFIIEEKEKKISFLDTTISKENGSLSFDIYRKPTTTDTIIPNQWRTQEFCSGGGGCSTKSVENRGQREWGSGGDSPLVRGSGGSCNLVQKISFHMVKFS